MTSDTKVQNHPALTAAPHAPSGSYNLAVGYLRAFVTLLVTLSPMFFDRAESKGASVVNLALVFCLNPIRVLRVLLLPFA